ncbi:hypothetical protein [Crossiella sp. NPDC003009]
MFGKRRRRRAAFEKLMAALEDRTAELILTYVAGKWNQALALARVLEEDLKPVATVPRMEICLYHVESIQLRIAFARDDVDLVGAIARKVHNPEVSRLAFDAVRKSLNHHNPGRIFREIERDISTASNAEGQIMRMRNPDPSLIGTKFFPNLYVPGQSDQE